MQDVQKGLVTPNTKKLPYEKYLPPIALAIAALTIVLAALYGV